MDKKKRTELEAKRIGMNQKQKEQDALGKFDEFTKTLKKLGIKYELEYAIDRKVRSKASEWYLNSVPKLPSSYATLDLDKMRDGRRGTFLYGAGDQIEKLFNVIAEEKSLSEDSAITLILDSVEFSLKLGDFLKTVAVYENCKADEGIVVVCPKEGWCLVANRDQKIFFGRV